LKGDRERVTPAEPGATQSLATQEQRAPEDLIVKSWR
jgi:hypothetical protein